jgi:hypothetical protein
MLKEIITRKAGFPFYTDYWKSYFCKMTGEQVKECLRIIFHFNETFEILESQDLAIEMVTTTIIGNIKRDAEKRTKQITANKNNGSKGGRPFKRQKPKITKSIIEDDQFESFWQSYIPVKTKDGFVKKGSREKAETAFVKALKKASFEKIMAALESYLIYCQQNNRLTKNAVSWLNEGDFEITDETCIIAKQPEPNNQLNLIRGDF